VVETLISTPKGRNWFWVSVLYREPMWLKPEERLVSAAAVTEVSVLYREPMWLKRLRSLANNVRQGVSVLYREPMWLKRR